MNPALCPNCETKVIQHACESRDCSWATCPNCGFYGIPERGIWRRPIPTKEKR